MSRISYMYFSLSLSLSLSLSPLVPPRLQQVGFDKCVASLATMVEEAKRNAGVDPQQPLDALVCMVAMVTKLVPGFIPGFSLRGLK